MLIALFGIIFLLFGTVWSKMPKTVPVYIFKLSVIFTVMFFAVMIMFIVIKTNLNKPDFNEDCVIVLGCGLKGDIPSKTLYSRLDKAIEYHEKNPSALIVVTGGQGKNELRTEAEAMAEYLVLNGIDEEKIIKEDKATSTNENFRFSKALLDSRFKKVYTVVCITNDFHAYRASRLAEIAGFNVRSYSCLTPLSAVVMCYLREVLAVIQLWIFKR
jgi:uncharacterized SAM-binding protein YcdF (DUF218 family)